MKASVKIFKLKKRMTNNEIARMLGVTHGSSVGGAGVFCVNDIWVGSKVNDETFTVGRECCVAR